MINVLVVDDSAFMRKMISSMLETDREIQVADKARNGQDALEKIKKLKPDVVTLDMEMPVMNGLEALKIIMKDYSLPVIMISSTTKEGTETTIQAMEHGAFDFIPKPSGSISLDINKIQTDLINKVKHAFHSVERRKSADNFKDKAQPEGAETAVEKFMEYTGKKTLIAIGTSTGGPKALQQVLIGLPEKINAPILIVQHMPKGFTKSLSERLNSLSKINVKEAENGEILKNGVAYIAPGGFHLKVRKIGTSLAVHLDESNTINGHRPSVDALFYSLASLTNYKMITVILTGMGSDGTKALTELRKNVMTLTLAESEQSAIVFGMPRAAIESGQVDLVIHINQVASTLVRYCQ